MSTLKGNLKLVWIIFKNSFLTAKKTPRLTITRINWLTLFKEIIAALLVVKADGAGAKRDKREQSWNKTKQNKQNLAGNPEGHLGSLDVYGCIVITLHVWRQLGTECVDCVHMAQHRVWWRVLMNITIPQKSRHFLSSWVTVSFRSTLLNELVVSCQVSALWQFIMCHICCG
jgi:hypothetical protein